ncbi:hypothetical protein YC2023_046326 [Brassica napus]
MALVGRESGEEIDAGSDGDDDLEQDLETEYKTLFDKFSDLSHENLELLKEKAMMKAQINILELDQPTTKTKTYSMDQESDQEVLALRRAMTEQERVRKEAETHIQRLNKLLAAETDRSRQLESQLTENHKKVRMLSSGTATLDHILTLGQCPSLNTGLGYKGSTSKDTETKFVKESLNEEKKPQEKRVPVERNKNVLPKPRRLGNGCHFCGKQGHNARFCYFRRHQYERAWRLNLCFTEPTAYGCVWIAKRDLYPNFKENNHSKINTSSDKSHTEAEHDLVCNLVRVQVDTEIVSNVAYTSAEEASQTQLPWYFDSGCSKHMTGNEDYLEKLELIRGGKVTFGDGGQGKIHAIGITSRPDVPKLSNVYFVEGLKANLISVSQLCDEGLEVIFNSKECRAVDARNNVVLRGIRSGNNCYLWRPSNVCFAAAESKLDLWHKKLGHMNTNGLFRLVNAEVVRGVPDLEKQTETVCGACCQGKQVKRTKFVGDNVNVVFDDSIGFYEARVTQTIDGVTPSSSRQAENEAENEAKEESEGDDEPEMTKVDLDQGKVHKNHSSSDVIGGLFDERVTRKKQIDFKEMVKLACFVVKMNEVECFVSLIEPKNIQEALDDEFWTESMHLELEQFERLQVWELSTYAKNLIKRFGMQTSKIAKTPMSTTTKLSRDSDGKPVDEKLYRAMIGSLLYLTASRPDLCLSVGICARYQAKPKESHMNAVKRIIKYVKGTLDFGLHYTFETNVNLAVTIPLRCRHHIH